MWVTQYILRSAAGLALAIAVLAPSGASLAQAPNKRPKTPLERARADHDRGALKQAATALEQLRATLASTRGQAQQLEECLQLLAVVYEASGRHLDALAVATDLNSRLARGGASVLTAPARQDAAALLGRIHEALDQPVEALAWYRKALAIPVGHREGDASWEPALWADLGDAAAEAGDKDAARAAYESAAKVAEKVTIAARASDDEIAQAQTAVRALARARLGLGDLDAALTALSRLLKAPLATADQDQAATLAEMAELCHDADRFERERDYLRQAIAAQGAPDKAQLDQAERHGRLAGALWTLGQWNDSLDLWKQTAAHYDAYLKSIAGDDGDVTIDDLLTAREGLTTARQKTNDFANAYLAATELAVVAQQNLDENDPRYERARAMRSALAGKVARYDEARQGLTASVAYWRNRKPAEVEPLIGSLNNLGVVEREQGHYDEAFALFGEAFELAGGHFAVDDARLAELNINMATLYAAQGRYATATGKYRDALAICDRHGAALHHLRAEANLNLAMLELSQGRVELAAKLAADSLQQRQELPNFVPADLLPHHVTTAAVDLARASLKRSAGAEQNAADLNAAERAIGEAKAVAEQAGLDKGPYRATWLYQLGMVHYLRGVDDKPPSTWDAKARQAWNEALVVQREHNLPSLATRTLSYLGLIELRSKNFAAARKLLAEAAAQQEILRVSPKLHFATHYNLAKALVETNETEEAIRVLNQALQVIELPRLDVSGGEVERARYFANFVPAFDMLVHLYAQTGRTTDALLAAEQARNRTFFDQIVATGTDIRETLASAGGERGQALLEREKKLLQEYQELQARASVTAEGLAGEQGAQKLPDELEVIRRQYAELRDQMYTESPFYRELLGQQASRIDAAQALPRLLADGDVLLAFHIGRLQSYLFVAQQVDGKPAIEAVPLAISDAQLKELNWSKSGPLTRGAVAKLVGRCRTRLDHAEAVRSLGVDVVTGLAAPISTAPKDSALTDVLLPPAVRERLKALAPAHLLVITDADLTRLPLEALPLPGFTPPRYIDDELPPVVYLPSISIADVLFNRPAASGGLTLLSVGNPVTGTSAPAANPLKDLQGAATECQRVAAAFARHAPVTLIGPDATKPDVVAQLAGKRFVHFATHGVIEKDFQNLFGYLYLTVPGASRSGGLELREIQELRLMGCDLAVLSACNTNVGAEMPFEADSTFSRAFLTAGAKRVIASFWPVNDAATSELVGGYFESLAAEVDAGREPDYAQLLQDARRRLRNDPSHPSWANPFYWAPFVLSGPPAE